MLKFFSTLSRESFSRLLHCVGGLRSGFGNREDEINSSLKGSLSSALKMIESAGQFYKFKINEKKNIKAFG